jgi:hypothetical protein
VWDSATSIGVVLGLLYLVPILSQVIGNPHWPRLLQQIGPMSAGLAIQATTNQARRLEHLCCQAFERGCLRLRRRSSRRRQWRAAGRAEKNARPCSFASPKRKTTPALGQDSVVQLVASDHNIIVLDATTPPLFTQRMLLVDGDGQPFSAMIGAGVGDVEPVTPQLSVPLGIGLGSSGGCRHAGVAARLLVSGPGSATLRG